MPNTHNTLGSLFSDIADAIRAKDGTSAEIVADTFPDRIEAIDTDPSGDATAVASDLLYSKTAYSQGQKLTGTMPNNGATGGTISTQGGTYTIPAGYTSGGTVTANITASTLTNSIIESCVMNPTAASGDEDTARVTVTVPTGYHTQTTVTKDFEDLLPGLDTGAANAQILDGYQAYDDHGNQLTGVMTNNGAVNPTISTQGGQYTIPQGYHSGSGKVTASINNVTGSIGGTASAGSATAAIANTDSMRTVASPSGTAGTDYFRVKATASGTNGSYTPKYTVTSGGYIGSDVTGTAQTVAVNGDTTGQTINIPKATFTVDGASVKTTSTGGGYVKDSATVGTVSSMTLPTAAAASADGTNKATIGRSTSDQYINIPVGYNSAKGSYKISAVANGSATTPATSVTAGDGTGSVASSTGIVTITTAQATKSVTPTVSAGYVSSGTAGTITVPSKTYTYQLPTTKAAATITPGTTNQTIAAGTYLTGTQTIAGDADLVAGNIKKNVNIFGVTGTYEGTSTSDATATAADILSGKTAYTSSGKVTGTLAIYDGTVIVNS